MASSMPVPAPPRTPTPPPDENPPENGLGLDGIPHATATEILCDPNSLSPADPNAHFGSMSANMVSPAGGSSVYSPLSLDSGKCDISSPFNFQTTTLAKSPVVKSVRHIHGDLLRLSRVIRNRLTYARILVKDVVTNTSTAVSPIRSSWSLLLGHRYRYRILCLSLHFRSAAQACRKIRRQGFGGVCVISRLQGMQCGVRLGHQPWRLYRTS